MVGRDYGINILMTKLTFKQYLTEARIAVPPTALDHAMQVTCSAYFSYIMYLAKKKRKKLGQPFVQKVREYRQKYGNFMLQELTDGDQIAYELQYPVKELPERYTKKLKLEDTYPVDFVLGDFSKQTQSAAEFYPAHDGKPPSIFVNLGALLGIEKNLGSADAIDEELAELLSNVTHELQHTTQELVLGKLHPKQQQLPTKNALDDVDEYLTSDIEFQPQITTAANDFKQKLGVVQSKQKIDGATATALMKAYVDPNGQMPQGLLKYKPHFQSMFFNALFKKDKQKWKKAVKDFHRLVLG